MPNYVKNIITILGNQAEIDSVLRYIKGKDTMFDFNTLIPMPDELNIESGSVTYNSLALYRYLQEKSAPQKFPKMLMEKMDSDESIDDFIKRMEKDGYLNMKLGKKAYENLQKYGAADFYYWRIMNWGTKWNALNVSVEDNTISFETAWSAPIPVLLALSAQFSGICFEHKWADENMGSNTGCAGYMRGGSTDITFYNDFSHDAYRIYQDCWGDSECIGTDNNGVYYRKNCQDCHQCD